MNEELVVESPDVNQLKRIAEQLKQTREQKGIALEEIAAETFIPLRLLKAMDEGRFERLPEPVFVQGFIRRYGDAIGLDGSALSKEFVIAPPVFKKSAEEFLSQDPEDRSAAPAPRNLGASRVEKKLPVEQKLPTPDIKVSETPVLATPLSVEAKSVEAKISDPKAEVFQEAPGDQAEVVPASVSEVSDRDPNKQDVAAPSKPDVIGWQNTGASTPGSKQGLYWFAGVGALALLGLGIFLIVQPKSSQSGSSSNPTSTPATNNVTPGNAPKVQTQPSPAVSPTTASSSPSPAATAQGPVSINIQVLDDSWVEVEADGKILTSEILTKGTQKSWAAQKELILSTGNAKGITYSYNQGAAKPMGTTANPETLTFPPKP